MYLTKGGGGVEASQAYLLKKALVMALQNPQ